MRLRNISYAIRTASEVASAGQRLLESLDRSGRLGGFGLLTTLVVGVGAGVGIGAVVFSKDVRKRLASWLVADDDHADSGAGPHDRNHPHPHVAEPLAQRPH